MIRLASAVVGGVLLVLAAPAHADSILYALAASQSRIDGYCLGANGGLSPNPVVSHPLPKDRDGRNLFGRRLLVADNRALYVALRDRIVAFSIQPGPRKAGMLTPLGEPVVQPAMNPYDLALAPGGQFLYVPQRGQSRIVAYPINAADGSLRTKTCNGGSRDGLACSTDDTNATTGCPETCPTCCTQFTSCIMGPSFAAYDALHVAASRLYVTAATQPGRIQTFTIEEDGRLCGTRAPCEDEQPCQDGGLCEDGSPCASGDVSVCPTPDQCQTADSDNTRDPLTYPYSELRRVNLPLSFVINGDLLYVTEAVKKRILAFQLDSNGKLPPQQRGPAAKQAASKTDAVSNYRHLVLSGSALIGSQFSNGRIEAYRLMEGGSRRCRSSHGCLPRRPGRTSIRDLRASPVRMLVNGNVLYVAGGELDRVWAFRLDSKGLPAASPFSKTDEQKDSFPNDVAVAVLSGDCGS